MVDYNRLQRLAEAEIEAHQQEVERLNIAANKLIEQSEWHLKQVESWRSYLGSMACEPSVERHLTLINCDNGHIA